MKRNKAGPKYFRLLVSASILVWVFVIITVLLVLQIRGNLKPYAADDVGLRINVSGRVVDLDEIGVGYAKVSLGNSLVRQYVFSDSQGRFSSSDLAPGEYLVFVEARGYKKFESTVNLNASSEYGFTLHKEGTKND